MLEKLVSLFSNDGFMPHIHCYLDRPELVWSMVITDALIGVAYLSISFTLIALIRKIKLPFHSIFLAFGLFIFACGATHFMEIYNLWVPNYWLAVSIKAITAVASVVTAIALFPLRAKVIAMVETTRQAMAREHLLSAQIDELHNSEERFKLLVESVKDYAIFMLDPDGNVASWNQGAKKFKGYEASEIVGKHFSAFYPEADIKSRKPWNELVEAAETGRFVEEGWRVRKDGTLFWANVTITALRDRNSVLVGFAKVTQDLTERKKREESLTRSQMFLDSILENIPNMVFVKEAESLRFVRFNKAGEELLGHSRSELIGKNDYDFFPKEQADFFTSKDRAVLNGTQIVDIPEEEIHTKQGTRILHTRKIPVLNAQGKTEYLLGIAEDITEWKAAQEDRLKVFGEKMALDEREHANRQTAFLADATTLLASSLDYHSTLRLLAESLVKTMASWCTVTLMMKDGVDRVAAKNRDPSKAGLMERLIHEFPVDLKDQTGIVDVIRTGKSQFRPLVQDEELIAGTQNEAHLKIIRELGCVSSMTVPIKIQETVHGTISLVSASADKFFNLQDLAIAEEIGKRAATAIENAKLYEAAQQAVQSRDEFLSIASHELKTPLTALKLQLEFARRLTKPEQNIAPTPEKAAKMLDTSTAQVNRLVLLVDDLLDVSRIEAGKLNFTFEPLDLSALVRDVSERYSDHLHSAGCTLSLDIPAVPLMVQGDRFRIEQVLLNVLSNAAKYGAQKPILVKVELDGDQVLVKCRDHGLGIPQNKIEKIFERFERAIAASNISGLGLGLYIAREIVNAHGGEIWAESLGADGSLFVIKLPLLKGNAS